MFNIPPQRLQNSLIFYITCIIVFTNGFFAIITLSRENIAFYNEGVNRALFLGKLLSRPAFHALKTGTFTDLDAYFATGWSQAERNPVTLFDKNWWPLRGDPARLPPEGYPTGLGPNETVNRSGVVGTSSRELFFPIYDGETFLGALEIGLPEFHSPKVVDAAWQVLFVAAINILLGVALAIFIAQIIVRPLNQLLDGLEAVGRGDYSQRVQVFGEGELAQVGRMFNSMSASLQEKISESLDRTRMLDEKVQELWEIYELTKAMGFNLNLHAILERFLEKALALSSSSYGQIMLCVAETGRLEWSVGAATFPRIARRTYDECLERCVRERSPFEQKTETYTMLFFPLLSGNAIHGVLFLAKVGQQSYSESVQRFLDTISPLGGSLIENARLYQHVVEMKDYVRHVLESVEAGVATIDNEGRLVTINSAFVKHLALPDLRAQQQDLETALQPLPDREFRETLCRLVRGRDSGGQVQRSLSGRFYVSQRKEMPLQVGPDEVRALQVRVHPLLGGKGILGKVVVLDDITMLKTIERRMFEGEKWVSLGKLAASVAHEIRNPLVAIRGLVEVIGEDLTGENARHVRVVIGEVNRLNRVVEELLQLTRPEKAELKRNSLAELLEELLLLVRHEAERHRVVIRREWSDGAYHATIDPEKVKQAFINVMLNAIQAMPQGGTLTISLKQTPWPGLPEDDDRHAIVVEFADTGHGIPREMHDKVFDPFFTTRPQGTGLGLAITRKIVDLHQGQIKLQSEPGQGTRVQILLPDRPDSMGESS